MSEAKTAMTPEMEALKAKLKETWSAGDFGQIALFGVSEAAEFINRLDLQPGEKVLDVACGTGNLAIPAAKAVPILVEHQLALDVCAQRHRLRSPQGHRLPRHPDADRLRHLVRRVRAGGDDRDGPGGAARPGRRPVQHPP